MTVTASAIKLWDAESIDNWTTNKGDVYSGFQREGSYCIGDQISATSFDEIYDYYSATGSYLNIDGKLVTFWVLIWGDVETLANGGVRYYLEDSTGNAVSLYIGGKDKPGMWWGAGWQAYAFYADATYLQNNVTYDQVSGSSFPDLTQLAKIGVGFNIKSKALGTTPNVYWDVSWAIDYLQVTGGTDTEPLTFDDIASADDTNAWGVFSKQEESVYFAQGKLIIGDTTNDTYFVDKNVMVIFKDMWVSDKLYLIEIQRGSGNVTIFQLGEKSGESGINGVTIRAPSGKTFVLDAYTYYDVSNMAQGDVGLYGSTFINMGEGKLPDSSYGEVLNTSFISCGMLYAYQSTIKYSNFITAPNRACWIPTNHNLSDSNFISNYVGIYVDTAGEYTLDAVKFTGNTYDIENASGGDVTINCVNGSNPTTCYNSAGGTCTIVNTVYVTIKVVDKANNPISEAGVWVYNLDDGVEIMNTTTDTDGIAQTTVNYTGDKSLEIHVRKSTPGEIRYIPVKTYGTLTSNGFSTTVTLYEDTVVA